MNRKEAKKEQTHLRYTQLYKEITKIGLELTIKSICNKLDISESTYYRIIRYNKELDETNNKIIKKKSKKIVEAGMIDNVDSTQLCYIDNCPTNTREYFDKDHSLYTHMIMCHVDEIASLTK